MDTNNTKKQGVAGYGLAGLVGAALTVGIYLLVIWIIAAPINLADLNQRGVVVDDGGRGGDGNFKVNRGDTFDLYVTFEDTLPDRPLSFAKLTSKTPGFTVLDSISAYPGSAGGKAASSGKFRCSVASDLEGDKVTAVLALAPPPDPKFPSESEDETEIPIFVWPRARVCLGRTLVVPFSMGDVSGHRLRVEVSLCNDDINPFSVGFEIRNVLACGDSSGAFRFRPVDVTSPEATKLMYSNISVGECATPNPPCQQFVEYDILFSAPTTIEQLKCVMIQGYLHGDITPNRCDFTSTETQDIKLWSRVVQSTASAALTNAGNSNKPLAME